jgi:EAL domain-containing protein (putative c-di-GMP-specific phosphodiesterase class I)
MENTMSRDELLKLLDEERIETHFQPITSVRRQAVVGLEALSRGRSALGETSGLISPAVLFGSAALYGLQLELDRACRRAAARAFAPIHKKNPQWILFLNVYTPAIICDMDGEHSIVRLIESAGIDPRNVAIEILETEIPDAKALQQAVESYRHLGFLVALDDVGAGHANLDRIAFIKPDLIKADRSLVRGLDQDYHRQEVFKSLLNLSERIGGWMVAEGIETSGEAQAILDLGGDIMQGFLLARPQSSRCSDEYGTGAAKQVALLFKQRMLDKSSHRRAVRQQRLQVLEAAISSLHGASLEEIEPRLREVADRFEIVDSISLLDHDGIQTTAPIVPSNLIYNQSVIFAPPGVGSDHSMKEYVFMLRDNGLGFFETAPYVPLPNGDLCVTMSCFFQGLGDKSGILVAHLKLRD